MLSSTDSSIPPWRSSAAKASLIKLLQSERGEQIRCMDPADIYRLDPLFQLYPFGNFKTNLKTLLKTPNEKPTQSKPPPPWRHSKAKEVLQALLQSDLDGSIHAMDADDVYKLSPLFAPYKIGNFKTNLENLKSSIAGNAEAVRSDHQALRHDQHKLSSTFSTLTSRGYPRWETSAAKNMLARDIKEKKHQVANATPNDLWKSRPEYQQFPLEVFRQHIYQEEYSQSGRSYWMHKKKLKADAKKDRKRRL
jgi:hypothetical protein